MFLARISDPAREKCLKVRIENSMSTNLAGDAMFVALTQPFDNKNMTFGVSTVSFTCVPVEEQFVGRDISNLGEGSDHSVFGVVHPDGSMDLHLAHKKI